MFDVVGIGNAIVDVLAADRGGVPRPARARQGRHDPDRRRRARRPSTSAMGPGIEISGGSAANTIAGLASLGGARRLYRQGRATTSSAACSATTSAPPASTTAPRRRPRGPPTARCLIFVTPDAQRTMQTFLGACVELGARRRRPDSDRRAPQVTYLEGYLWDPPPAQARRSSRPPSSPTRPGARSR